MPAAPMWCTCSSSDLGQSLNVGCTQACKQGCGAKDCGIGDECFDFQEAQESRHCSVTCTVYRVVVKGSGVEKGSFFGWLPGQAPKLVVEVVPTDHLTEPQETVAGLHAPGHGDEQVWIWNEIGSANGQPAIIQKGSQLTFDIFTTTQLVVRAIFLQGGWFLGGSVSRTVLGEVRFLPILGLHGSLFLPLVQVDGQAQGMVMLTITLHCEGEQRPRVPLLAPRPVSAQWEVTNNALEEEVALMSDSPTALPTWQRRGVMARHEGAILCCAVFPDGRRVLTGSSDTTVGIWSSNDASPLMRLRGHERAVVCCAVTSTGEKAVTSCSETGIVWSCLSGEKLASLPHFACCTPFPNGDRLLLAGPSNDAAIFLTNGQHQAQLTAHSDRITSCAVFSSGDRILTTSRDQDAVIWTDSGGLKCTLRGHAGPINACAVFPRRLQGFRVVTASDDKTAIIWGAVNGEKVADLAGHNGSVTACAVVLGGNGVLTVSTDRTGILWSAQGERLAELQGHNDSLTTCVAFASGRRAVVASLDGTAYVWELPGDPPTAKMSAVLRRHTTVIREMVTSPHEDYLFTASEDHTGVFWSAPAAADRTRPPDQPS